MHLVHQAQRGRKCSWCVIDLRHIRRWPMSRHSRFLYLITLVPASNPHKNGRVAPRIAWAVCLLVLSLCGANATPPQDQATLYFFNTSGWAVFPGKLTVLDNDKKVGGPTANSTSRYRSLRAIIPCG